MAKKTSNLEPPIRKLNNSAAIRINWLSLKAVGKASYQIKIHKTSNQRYILEI